ncbi:MAG: glycosyltransferase [Chloroflexota bacterium]
MRILFVVPYVPNLIRVRPYNLIRSLSARGHQVTVLTVCADEQDWKDVKQLEQHCYKVQAVPLPRWRSWANCLGAVPGSTPLQAVYCWQPELARQIAAAGHEADVVHIEHLRGAHYGLYLKSGAANGARRVPVVWDSVDCISALFRQASGRSKRLVSRWITRFELGRTERYEGWLVDQFDRVLVTSPADKDALGSLRSVGKPERPISVIANGVDLAYFEPDYKVNREPATLVISGKMSYHANVSMSLYMAKVIMPHIWAKRPDAKLCIVGKDPTPDVLALAQNPAITVTGTVDNIRPYLQKATVAVTPITYGAGIQNKVLEAMACATPVVSTPQAVSALEVTPGRDTLVAQEPEGFAAAVLRLLDDPQHQQQIGLAGRRYVETHHQWSNVAARLEGVYDEVISSKS